MIKLTIAIFLAGLTRCSSSSSKPWLHRSLQSETCFAADAALYDANPNLGATEAASYYDLLTILGACTFANAPSGDCTVDAAGLATSTAYAEACQAAGGDQYSISSTYSCSAMVDGSEVIFTGGLINDVYCYAPSCTLNDVKLNTEDLETVYIPDDVDQTVFTCTGGTSVDPVEKSNLSFESGASSANIKLWSVVLLVAGVLGSGLCL